VDISKIDAIVEDFARGTDLFLVEVKATPAGEIEVIVDSDTAVSIDQCVSLSRTIEAAFDRDVEDFELSVGSAGIGQPLKLARQYRKTVGRSVEVVMKDGMKYVGVLESVGDEAITLVWEEKQLVEGKKRRQTVEVRKEFPLGAVKSTRQQLLFK
jgi:ribosome maturation factor RimP